jgi:osmotically-inducible protein OsmY
MKVPIILFAISIAGASCDKSDKDVPPPQMTSPHVQTPSDTSRAVPDMPTHTTTGVTTRPDDSGINVRDRSPGAITPTTQGEDRSDLATTASIRRQIMDAKLSITAENVKVVCQMGKVTLRGPVNTQQEKDAIGKIASGVAGPGNVDNQLDVKPNGG